MRVVVVGGGVVGLCCAHELARRGAEVCVVERDECGHAASLRNAGQIVPSLCAPLSKPGVVGQSLRWLLDRDSPLRLRASLDPGYLHWLWCFARSASPTRYRSALRAIVALGRDTHQLFDELRSEGVRFEMHSKGILFATLTREALAEDVEMYRELAEAGYEGEVEVLDGDSLRRLEPALSDAVVGGLNVRSERHARPESLVVGLRAHLLARGVRISEHTEVAGLSTRGGGGWWVHTPGGDVPADRVLIAAGVWSRDLLARLGVRIPLEAAKGYSLTSTGGGTAPEHPIKFAEAQVVCTPYDGCVRVSGMFELTGRDPALRRARLEAVVRAARPYLRDWTPSVEAIEWAGFRPATPDSLPLIGPTPGLPDLYVATGHGMLGLTLAPATARLLAPLVLEARPAPDLQPFRLDRFRPARARADWRARLVRSRARQEVRRCRR